MKAKSNAKSADVPLAMQRTDYSSEHKAW